MSAAWVGNGEEDLGAFRSTTKDTKNPRYFREILKVRYAF